jgi:RimJ/RimL family protein N-acetyltransferase
VSANASQKNGETEVAGRIEAMPYDERFLECSWQWLQDPQIAHLTMTPPFAREQQRAWFARLPGRTDYLVWGIALDRRPIGVFGIKNIEQTRGEYWGYLGEKDCWGRGFGRWMIAESVERARQRGLRELVLRVAKWNPRAQTLYQRCGFVVTREEADVFWMRRDV